jgi:hemoglobin-like flavoprotein
LKSLSRFFTRILIKPAAKKTADQNLFTAIIGRCAFFLKSSMKIALKMDELTKKHKKTQISQSQYGINKKYERIRSTPKCITCG